nr:3-oxoacyl-[acyl-carrier-protein] reductase FabG-like [Helicoverpa armigera]
MSFPEKVVIVTGASSGIGAAIAVKFAEQGASVVLTARNQARLKEVADKCGSYGAKHCIIIADLTKKDEIEKIVATTVEHFGKIDVLVNNAGIAGRASIWEANAMELYDTIMATNLHAVVYLTNLAAPHLIKTKGNIVNISSIAAVNVIKPEQFAYCTSKAGLDHFTRSAALDFASKGVRVNSINPGPVETNIAQCLGDRQGEFWNIMQKMTALGRLSDSEEIADLVLFVASDKAKAITGSSYITDNGLLLKRGA